MRSPPPRLLIGEAPVVDELALAPRLPLAGRLTVAGVAREADRLAALAAEVEWDLMLADLNTLRGTPLPMLQALRQGVPPRRVLVLCADDSRGALRTVLRAGVDGCVVRIPSLGALAEIAVRVAAGQVHFDPVIASVFREPDPEGETYSVVDPQAWHLEDAAGSPLPDGLTQRERDIVRMVAVGWANKVIARRLDISLPTVRKHRENLMRKLGLHNAAGVTAYAISRGLAARDPADDGLDSKR